MFKMNPAAKEFVPAHILKRRQEEEAARLGELTEQLNKVDIKSEKEENGESSNEKLTANPAESSKEVQENSASSQSDDAKDSKPQQNDDEKVTTTSNNNQENDHPKCEVPTNGQYMDNNNHDEGEYPEGLQDLIDEEDDRFLLNAGEDLCEFNGEQFIIPGDDEYEPPIRAGYDFGNDEDNEDEDICNAFEEFLANQ